MTESTCKHDTKSRSHVGMKLASVRVFSCKHPLRKHNGQTEVSARAVIGGFRSSARALSVSLHLRLSILAVILVKGNEKRNRKR